MEECKQSLQNLLDERDALFEKLQTDNETLQALLEETTRGKEALGKCISQLSMEKQELKKQLEAAQEEIEQLSNKAPGESLNGSSLIELGANVEDVAVINEGLRESMRLMQLKHAQGTTIHNGLFD